MAWKTSPLRLTPTSSTVASSAGPTYMSKSSMSNQNSELRNACSMSCSVSQRAVLDHACYCRRPPMNILASWSEAEALAKCGAELSTVIIETEGVSSLSGQDGTLFTPLLVSHESIDSATEDYGDRLCDIRESGYPGFWAIELRDVAEDEPHHSFSWAIFLGRAMPSRPFSKQRCAGPCTARGPARCTGLATCQREVSGLSRTHALNCPSLALVQPCPRPPACPAATSVPRA